jgi:hypothetical protein
MGPSKLPQVMAILVVEFKVWGYKIRSIFWIKIRVVVGVVLKVS